MELTAIKQRLREIEPELSGAPWISFASFEREGRVLHIALTDRLRKRARKEGVWNAKELFVTLKNAAYGFDERRARSGGGADGIFLLDRSYRPENAMMRKLFDGFLDKPGSGAEAIAVSLGTTLSQLLPVRLVSHHLRLLGVLCHGEDTDWLVLVDCDRTA
jgi:hypothetical protein